jgi:hypothetical protein
MWKAMSVYAGGGEEAVKMTGGQAATLLLQHLEQVPMPIIEERARARKLRHQGMTVLNRWADLLEPM